MTYDIFQRKWFKSISSWIITVNRLKYGPWGRKDDLIRRDIANVFLRAKNALIIAHKNFLKKWMYLINL